MYLVIQMKNNTIKNVISKTHDTISSVKFKEANRTLPKYFTRERKMSFMKLTTFILNFLSKPLQIELDKYFENVEEDTRISQQAFSKARQHIKPEAFRTLFEITSEEGNKSTEIKKYKGYRIFAIDGSELNLEPTEELVRYYGRRTRTELSSKNINTM